MFAPDYEIFELDIIVFSLERAHVFLTINTEQVAQHTVTCQRSLVTDLGQLLVEVL